MFIQELNKNELIAFMNLLSEFASTDNIIKKEEQELINTYSAKANLSNDEMKKMTYEESINSIKTSSERTLNIVYLELVRVGLSDGECQLEEIDFLEKLTTDLGISRSKKLQVANFFYKFSNLNEETSEMKSEAEKIL